MVNCNYLTNNPTHYSIFNFRKSSSKIQRKRSNLVIPDIGFDVSDSSIGSVCKQYGNKTKVVVKKTKNIIEIINKAKKGDENSFTSLLNMFWKDVYRFLYSKTNDENEAEDVTIRSFAKAFEKIDTFDENYEFKTWLLSISSNLYIDQLRKRKTDTISIHKKSAEAHKVKDEEPTPADKLINI